MREFYSIETGVIHDKTGEYRSINTEYYKDRKTAQKALDKLFKRCYPFGFKSLEIQAPKYNDLTTLLDHFVTEALYTYSLTTLTFED